ncbi:aminoglycoside phosphotransferase family protein [Loktanella sp. Alg231-35]|uniref:aminoglycoside phosphotransferase family protein n=1 Tax=Loktanella sp. Alg231-35 TaxID=1922220 RepID=UPI000D561FE6|nr:phosphotransferase [Loktanella sp. Alg231-35]
MVDRATLIKEFLQNSPWVDWDQTPITGDASSRRYLRLHRGDKTVILMDAPPENGEDTTKFAELAAFLNSNNLSAPKVLAHAPDIGLMVIADLGTMDFAAVLKGKPADQATLYDAAVDVLITLKTLSAPQGLPVMTPQVGAQMIDILGTHYTRSSVTELCAEVECALATHAPNPDTLALRDFHAENMIWRPDHKGNDRVGLLDFQDAFIAPEGYDLASLLRDVRRDIPRDVVAQTIDNYCARTNAPANFRTQLACLGVQRNLRILGVFARLATDHQKPRYLAFMPRVWTNILHDLGDPALDRLKRAVLATAPPPTTDILNGLIA